MEGGTGSPVVLGPWAVELRWWNYGEGEMMGIVTSLTPAPLCPCVLNTLDKHDLLSFSKELAVSSYGQRPHRLCWFSIKAFSQLQVENIWGQKRAAPVPST